jgi:phosphate transport system substrate-binding protein
LLPIIQRAAEVYLVTRPDLLLTISGTGTGEGVRSLIDGNIDIADASRDLKPEESQRAKARGLNLTRYVVALDCLAVIVHPDNPVANLTMAQLKGIYDGSIKNWNEVGGADMVIVPVNRDSSSGTFEMWIEKVLKGERHRRDVQVQSSSGGVAYAVSGNRHAIGYVSLGFLSESVKSLSVDGVMPSKESALSGRYPILRELYMFLRSDRSKEAGAFLSFVLSPSGAKVVEEEGFLPPVDITPALASELGEGSAAGDMGGPGEADAAGTAASDLGKAEAAGVSSGSSGAEEAAARSGSPDSSGVGEAAGASSDSPDSSGVEKAAGASSDSPDSSGVEKAAGASSDSSGAGEAQ